MKRPIGAIASVDDMREIMKANKPLYHVWTSGELKRRSKKVIDNSTRLAWFTPPLQGYIFNNYFHALAYSLKIKSKQANKTP